MENLGLVLDNFKNKRVFITGHTGFKGTWLCRILLLAGAKIRGFSLPLDETSIFYTSSIYRKESGVENVFGDIRDFSLLRKSFEEFKPEYVIHLAAQPLVRPSYEDPRYTYEVNVMGTVNLLDCLRESKTVRSALNVTTDKVYENKEWCWGYREYEPLDGFDPYSNSKSCSELVTHSYTKSFVKFKTLPLSTARAGNVIGGGDFSRDRIIPDCYKALSNSEAINVRNQFSIRPYQHVLEPLFAYLLILYNQKVNSSLAGAYNVGPNEDGCVTTGRLVQLFCDNWSPSSSWRALALENQPHEANFLKLDNSKIKEKIGWKPRWGIEEAVNKTVEWYKVWDKGSDETAIMDRQIFEYIKGK